MSPDMSNTVVLFLWSLMILASCRILPFSDLGQGFVEPTDTAQTCADQQANSSGLRGLPASIGWRHFVPSCSWSNGDGFLFLETGTVPPIRI